MTEQHIHVHLHIDEREPAWAKVLGSKIDTIQETQETIMANQADFTDVLGRIDTATSNIADDIRRIKDQLSTGMTAADVQAVKDTLEAKAVTLEGIAADTEDPVPEEPPVEPPNA